MKQVITSKKKHLKSKKKHLKSKKKHLKYKNNKTKKNNDNIYIFSYGGIINSNSRNYTKETLYSKAIPVILKKSAGYERNWVSLENSKHGKFSFLGINKTKNNNNINGVLFKINKNDLIKFDKRELPDYYRRKINRKFFKHYFNKDLPNNIIIYTYIIKKKYLNDNKCPILQTYLDVVLQGCLEYNTKFAKMFLDTTGNWKPIYNDRINKLYSNFKNIKLNYKQIDNILKNTECF